MQYKAADPAAGRKDIFVLLANLGIRPDSYDDSVACPVACTKEQMEQFELDLQTVADAVRDGDIRVKSRGAKTTLLAGVNPYVPGPVGTELCAVASLEANFLPHTPGANVGGASVRYRRCLPDPSACGHLLLAGRTRTTHSERASGARRKG
jgi:hypothetical protein